MAALGCLLWAWMSTVANGNLDSQFDMLENYAWSQSFRWGTHKHPPLFAWVVGAWFAVFPQTDWAYRLLSYANVWVALAGVAALGRRLGLGTLAQWGALLLLWSFPYTTLAGKFNANSQLLPLWPWTAALLLAEGIGEIVRSATGAATAAAVLVVLAPQLASILGDAVDWLPGQAGQIWVAGAASRGDVVAAGLIALAWTATATAAGAARLVRADA